MRFSSGILFEALIILIALPASILLNRHLGAEARGILAAMLLMPCIAGTVVSSQWDRTLRAQITSKVNSPAEVWTRTKKYTWLMSVVGLALSFVLIGTQWQLTIEQRFQAMLAALFLVPLSLAGLFMTTFLAAINDLNASYTVRVVGPVVFLLVILLGVWQGLSVPVALSANVLLWVGACLVGWFFLRSHHLTSVSVRVFDANIKTLLSPLPPFALEVMSLQADVWFLSAFVGNVVTGAYVAFRVFEFPLKVIVFGMINVGSGRVRWTNIAMVQDFVRKGSLTMALVGGAVMAGTLLFGRFLVVTVLGESFGDQVWMLPYIVAAGALANTAFLFLTVIQLQGQQALYLKIQSADGVLRIVLIGIGCLIGGAHGVLIAICAASFIKLAICGLGLVLSRSALQSSPQLEAEITR